MRTQTILSLSLAAALSVAPAFAGISYVDATSGSSGNTTLADGSTFSPPLNGTTGNDNNWEARTPFGSSGTIFESSGETGAENAPELRTKITGLVPGNSYSVFAYFWDPASNAEDWNLRAGASSNPGANTLFSHADATVDLSSTGSVLASSQTFAGGAPTILTEGGRDLLAAPLGTLAADSNGEIKVYVDDLGAAGTVNKRTWFDGVGYELVTTGTPIVASSWAAGLGTPGLAGLSSTGLAWGDNSANNADNTAVHATIDGDAGTFAADPVSLADGQSVRLSGKVNFQSSITDTAGTIQFRWGLFNHNSSVDASGWTGYWAGNGTTGSAGSMFRQNNTSTLYVSGNVANGTALTPGTQVPGSVNIVAGLHDFSLVLTRSGSNIEYSAIMTRSSDGALLCEMAGTDSGGYTTFTRIGFLSGGGLDADQLTLSGLALEYPYSPPPIPGPGDIVEVAPNGTWTWFNDERAIWHQGMLYSGYMRNDGYAGITRYNPATNTSNHTILGTAASFQIDDHNNPSITVLPNGNLMVLYAKHLGGSQFYQRTSLVNQPSSIADWGPEIVRPLSANNTYNNTYRLSAESNRIYNFHRNINFNPTITVSNDFGATWQTSVQFIEVGTNNIRPYPRYCSNHSDRIDLIYTDGHPRDVDNSVYHMSYSAGSFLKTDGTLIDTYANLPLDHQGGQRGSVIYQFSNSAWGAGQGPDNWIPGARGWTWDVHYGKDGNPVCVFQAQLGTDATWSTSRIYYYYARWTGTTWEKKFIAQAGRGIYAAESDYGGGMCLDPEDPRVVYISSNAAAPFSLSDVSNVPLATNARYEIYRGVTLDGGLTFSWTPVTENSTADNLRPIVPENHGLTKHLLWMRGTYTTYQNYNTKVMGIFDVPEEGLADWQTSNSLGGDANLDTDHDGLSDLLEYALGGNPNNPGDRPAPTLLGDKFTFNHLPLRTDVEWVVETSTDLSEGSWNPLAVIRAGGLAASVNPGLTLTENPGSPASVSLSPLPPNAGPRSFVRLKVRAAPLPPGQ